MRLTLTTLFCAALAGLGACSGNDDAPAAPLPSAPPAAVAQATLSGVAAVGSPLAGATVTATCTSGPQLMSLPTSSSGGWTLDVPANTLPCALEAGGGTVAGVANLVKLHALAAAAGRVNITPLTDLAIAHAAVRLPADWFAGLLDARSGTALDARTATSQLLAALATAGYTVPGGSFDPFSAVFEAQSSDAYDALLDALQATLNHNGQSYADLLAALVSSNGPLLNLPPIFTGITPTPPSHGAIVLLPKGNATAADIAPLVGSYHGSLGRVFRPGQPTVDTASCTIDVAADGTMTVSAGDRSIAAAMGGDVGDLILSVLDMYRVQASDTGTDRYAQLTTVRGVLAQGVARQGGTGFTTAEDRVECTLPNPAPSSAGSTTVARIQGATAADMAASLVGTYSGAGCTVTIGENGVLHLTSSAVDITTALGGDENDVIVLFGGAGVLQAQDYFTGGEQIYIAFTYEAANPALNLPASFSAEASHREPRPWATLAQCSGLTRQ